VTDPDTNKRFDRLEVKLDKLTEVLTNVARVEEKLNSVNARLKRHEFRLDENEKKTEEVSDQVTTNNQVIKVGQAILLSLWAALVSSIAYTFRD
tara:strand:- start:1888 stop:2169 length:282 start_codon:yes stop_codon:yes gene_type:complete